MSNTDAKQPVTADRADASQATEATAVTGTNSTSDSSSAAETPARQPSDQTISANQGNVAVQLQLLMQMMQSVNSRLAALEQRNVGRQAPTLPTQENITKGPAQDFQPQSNAGNVQQQAASTEEEKNEPPSVDDQEQLNPQQQEDDNTEERHSLQYDQSRQSEEYLETPPDTEKLLRSMRVDVPRLHRRESILPGSTASQVLHGMTKQSRRRTMLPSQHMTLRERPPTYKIQTKNFKHISSVSLLPKKMVSAGDPWVDSLLKKLTAYRDGDLKLTPEFHDILPLTEASKLNGVVAIHTKVIREKFTAVINDVSFKQDGRAIPANLIRACMKSIENHYCNPIFIGTQLLHVLQKHPKAQTIWRNIKSQHVEFSTIKATHILDLYAQAEYGTTMADVKRRDAKFRNWEQRHYTCKQYVEKKFELLRELAQCSSSLKDHASLCNNALIDATVRTAMMIIRDSASVGFQRSLSHDVTATANGGTTQLPWSVEPTGFSSSSEYISYLEDALLKFAVNEDRQQSVREGYLNGGGSSRYSRQRFQHRGEPLQSRRTTSAAPDSNGAKKPGGSKLNKSAPCTHRGCKQFPPHNVGGVRGCKHLCRLHQRNIKCPLQGKVNDCDGLHLFRQECRQAFREHSSSTKTKSGTSESVNVTTTPASQKLEDVFTIRAQFLTPDKSTDDVGLSLMLDTGASINVIQPSSFEQIRHLSTYVDNQLVCSSGCKALRPRYVARCRMKPDGPIATTAFCVAELPITQDGVIGRPDMFANGFMLTDTASPVIECDWSPEGGAVNSLAALTAFDRASQALERLAQQETITEDCIEAIMADLPTDEHPQGFDADAALRQLLVTKKAERGSPSTAFQQQLNKILHYKKLNTLTPEQQSFHQRARDLLAKVADDITTADKFPKYNTSLAMQGVKHVVTAKPNPPIVQERAIPMQPPVQRLFEEWHDKMVANGCISRATTQEVESCSCILNHMPVLKRGAERPFGLGDYRFVLLAAPLSNVIQRVAPFEFATRREVREFAKGKQYFSSLDCAKFFPTIPAEYDGLFLHMCKGDYFKYNVVVQGEHTAPSAAHKVMMAMFSHLVSAGLMMIHVDDILVGTVTGDQHLEILEQIFSRLREFGVNLNAGKSILCRPVVTFLGLVVTADGVEPDLMRYSSIFTWPRPTTKRQLKKFIGFMNYFHNFIENCADLLSPLRDAEQTPTRTLKWTPQCQEAFDNAKAALMRGSMLHHIDYNATMHIHVDTATSNGIGAVLYQERDGKKYPIMFQSRRLTAAERKYTPTDAELCGVYWATTKAFHDIIQFSDIVIHSDHKNLIHHIDPRAASSHRRERWCYYLGDYNIVDVVHEAGASFTDADTLSRVEQLVINTISSSPPSDVSLDNADLRAHQATDEFCQSIVTALSGGEAPTTIRHICSRCRLTAGGILQYRDFQLGRGETNWLVVVPSGLRERVIRSTHDRPHGHRGYHATALSIRAHWWWPKMIEDIRAHVSKCEVCRQAKTSGNTLRQGTLSTYQPLFPGQCLAIDIYDPSDTGGEEEQSAKLALVAVYSFTRNVCVVPLMSKSPTEVAKALTTIFADFGIPSMIRHDRGREFDGAVLSLCETLGIEQIRSAPHSAQSNGTVERVNQELKKELRRLRKQLPGKQWEDLLPIILTKLRSTINSSTKFSPYELMGITSPAPRGATCRTTPEQFMDFRDFNAKDFALVKSMTASMQQRRQRSLVNDIESRDDRLTNQNKARKPMEFSKGQWIRVLQPSSNKMEPQVTEPKLIIDVSDDKIRYTAQDPTTGRTTEVFIGNMIPSQAPTYGKPNRHTRTGQQAAIARKITPTGTTYFVVDNSPKARTSSIRRLFTNARPRSQATQSRWILNEAQTVKDCEILTEFTFDISKTGHFIIPKLVRKAHKDVDLIQGRLSRTY